MDGVTSLQQSALHSWETAIKTRPSCLLKLASRQRPVNQRLTNSVCRAPGHSFNVKGHKPDPCRASLVSTCFCLISVLLIFFLNMLCIYMLRQAFLFLKERLHPAKTGVILHSYLPIPTKSLHGGRCGELRLYSL